MTTAEENPEVAPEVVVAAPAAPAPVEPSPRLVGVLRALARRTLALSWLSGASRILALLLALGVARCLFDYWVQLDWIVRVVFLVVDAGIAGWLGWRWLWKPWKRRLTLERSALRLERVFPAAAGRLIAAWQLPGQLSRGNLSSELVGIVARDTDSFLALLPWREAAPAKPALRGLGLLAAAIVVAGGLFALQPETAAVLARRWLLSTEPAVTRTRLDLAQTDLRVALGSPVSLSATATGVVPRQAVFEVRPAAGEPRNFPVSAADETPGVFTLAIDNVRQGFRYRVRAGDARSEWHEVETLPAPVLVEPRFTVRPPAYTGLPQIEVEPGVEIVAPAGSTILVAGRSTLPLASARVIHWTDSQDDLGAPPVTLALSADALAFNGSVVLNTDTAALSFSLEAKTGVPSQDDTQHPVRFIPDAAPVVEFPYAPADGDSGVTGSGVEIRVRASDDYGVSGVTLHWEITPAKGDSRSGSQALNLPAATGKRADLALFIAPGAAPADTPGAIALAATPGAAVAWWIVATDNAPSPNSTATPRRTLRVVTPDEKLTEMMGRLREGMGELDDVSRNLERVNDSLGRILPNAPAPKTAP